MKKFIILMCTILMLTACASTEQKESNAINGNTSTDIEEIENGAEVTEYLNSEDLYETSFSSYSQNFDVKQGEYEWRLMVPYLKGTAGVNAYYFDLETSGMLGIVKNFNGIGDLYESRVELEDIFFSEMEETVERVFDSENFSNIKEFLNITALNTESMYSVSGEGYVLYDYVFMLGDTPAAIIGFGPSTDETRAEIKGYLDEMIQTVYLWSNDGKVVKQYFEPVTDEENNIYEKGSIVKFGNYNFLVLDANEGQIKLLSQGDSVTEKNGLTYELLKEELKYELFDTESFLYKDTVIGSSHLKNYINELPKDLRDSLVESTRYETMYELGGIEAYFCTMKNGDKDFCYNELQKTEYNEKVFPVTINDIVEYLGPNFDLEELRMMFNMDESKSKAYGIYGFVKNDDNSIFTVSNGEEMYLITNRATVTSYPRFVLTINSSVTGQ